MTQICSVMSSLMSTTVVSRNFLKNSYSWQTHLLLATLLAKRGLKKQSYTETEVPLSIAENRKKDEYASIIAYHIDHLYLLSLSISTKASASALDSPWLWDTVLTHSTVCVCARVYEAPGAAQSQVVVEGIHGGSSASPHHLHSYFITLCNTRTLNINVEMLTASKLTIHSLSQ